MIFFGLLVGLTVIESLTVLLFMGFVTLGLPVWLAVISSVLVSTFFLYSVSAKK